VCRDFAHLAIALNRTFNLPARYVTGHLPDIGFPDPLGHMDFHAYTEVYLSGHWYTSDARFHVPRIGRVKVSCGLDAVDGAFSTIYRGANLSYFEIWAYQVARGSVAVGDPVELSKRLDNQWQIQTDAVYYAAQDSSFVRDAVAASEEKNLLGPSAAMSYQRTVQLTRMHVVGFTKTLQSSS
jgi:transglutaminase-like putative cysteine protease